ncbi:LemA family protein [Kordiimonas marina]|uniref:LemA family protein n=1 Tax=Kordiimonas marina TaxID=2872312 RepID=UPI001FF2D054|nr:LemA family protein [Kordiimonas marina]MCJ9428529.1 LemA family protein [Kordiimonas marina]
MEPLIILIGLGLFLVIWGVIINNGIIRRRNMVIRSWSDVITYERQKNMTLPELERHAKAYGEHEKGLLTNITALRSSLNNVDTGKVNTEDLAKIERQTQSLMAGFRVAVEAYPNLKQADVTLRLMREISELQDNIAAAITIFNGNVASFNNGIQTFPNSLINSLSTHEKPYKPFRNEEAEEGLGFRLEQED